jgi:hypothetical protein
VILAASLGTPLLAPMRLNVPPVLLRCGVSDGDGDCDFLDGDFVHDARGGVCSRRYNLAVSVDSVLDVCSSSDNGGSSGRNNGWESRDDRRRRNSGGLNGEDGDAARAHGVSGGVGLCGDRSDRGDDGLGGGLVARAARLEGVGVAGAVLDGDVAAETLCGAGAVVLHEHLGHLLDLALALLSFGLERRCEDGAVFDAAGQVGAGVDGGLEGVDVPAVHEVAVVSVACGVISEGHDIERELRRTGGVTVGPDELAVLAVECVGVPDGLVEERRQTDGELLRALAAINQVGVSNVALVVVGCSVLAVPA